MMIGIDNIVGSIHNNKKLFMTKFVLIREINREKWLRIDLRLRSRLRIKVKIKQPQSQP